MIAAVDLAEKTKQYWQDGYTVLPGLFGSEEVDAFRAECERLWNVEGLDDDLNLRTEFRRGPDGGYAFDRLDPVLDISPTLNGAATGTKLMGALEAVLGGSAEILKCKLIRKEPGVKGYATHQDFLYWKWLDTAPDLLCTVVINLYPSDERSGGIAFYRGSHQELVPGPPGNPEGDCDPDRLDPSRIHVPALAAGDVLVFHSLTPHFSGPNDSEHPRTVLLPSYCVTDDTKLYQKYYQQEIIRRCKEMVGFERYFARNESL
ncbi:phytanoyl-CoA dioxygenase family protein [Streptomyces sp. C11-1]|uniref:Phytanoyl-CoA dioxygenase family protein n=1 Tax=Streptomyces durocortorensis TaxID=2811104 RepID=A0ABY9VZ73_9ACTN|nr:phytanoyl-CoA dioxygenase family protein [Streptomyces durocortorensis]WNF29195.1 phytanoyl-CoA dioxygenase family protein [Streptomyces durocortorensis]